MKKKLLQQQQKKQVKKENLTDLQLLSTDRFKLTHLGLNKLRATAGEYAAEKFEGFLLYLTFSIPESSHIRRGRKKERKKIDEWLLYSILRMIIREKERVEAEFCSFGSIQL